MHDPIFCKDRTGTVVGCYLARHGIAAGNDVIKKIKELRKDTEDFSDPSPETREQIKMVNNWGKEYQKSTSGKKETRLIIAKVL